MESSPSAREYGADFAAAINAAIAIGAPVILGDNKVKDSIRSLREPGPIADVGRISRGARLAFGGLRRFARNQNVDAMTFTPISGLACLIDDPGKLLPLLTGVWWIFLGTVLSAMFAAPSTTQAAVPLMADPDSFRTVFMAVSAAGDTFLTALSVRIFDVFFLSRDEALADVQGRPLPCPLPLPPLPSRPKY